MNTFLIRTTFLFTCILLLSTPCPAQNLRSDMESVLQEHVLQKWFPLVISTNGPGFDSDFDVAWQPGGSQDRMIVAQARHTWTAAKAALRYPDQQEYHRAAAVGFECLRDVMWDQEHGGFYWNLNQQGRPDTLFGQSKHVYGIGFGIYACAAVYELTGDEAAADLAYRAFDWLQEHAYDSEHGGYYVFLRRDGTPVLTADQSPLPESWQTGPLGVHFGYKDMNTHIHVLEGFAELYKVKPTPRLKAALEELFLIVRDRIAVPPGALHTFLNPDWRPVPNLDSYGHDIETGYLLIEAAEALDMLDETTLSVAKSLVDHTLECAWDPEEGGIFGEGSTFCHIHSRGKSYWAQTETLHATLQMAHLFPSEADYYMPYVEGTWGFITNHLIDQVHGGFRVDGSPGRRDRPDDKGNVWKTGYHNARALMHCMDLLQND